MADDTEKQKQRSFKRGIAVLQELYGAHDEHIERVVGQFAISKVFPGSQHQKLGELFGTKDEFSAELANNLIERALASPQRKKIIAESFSALSHADEIRSRQTYFEYCARRLAYEDPLLILRHHVRPYIPLHNDTEVSIGHTLLLAMYRIDPESIAGDIIDVEKSSVLALASIDTLAVIFQNESHE